MADPDAQSGGGRSLWRAAGRAVQGAWLALGAALALFAAAETAVRLVDGRSGSSPAPAESPDTGLVAQVRRDQARRRTDVDPYRGEWSLPLQTAFVNIDDAGRRVTPQGQGTAGGRRVVMLGGSAMWGTNAPDSSTVPALVAAALRGEGITDVEVVNLAQPGFVSMQGAMTLLVELAAGRVPTVAVVLVGTEDVLTAVRHGEPGRTAREADYERWLRLGLRSLRGEVRGLSRHSELVRVLSRATDDAPEPVAPGSLCRAVAGHLHNLAEALDALARAHGFTLLLAMVPTSDSVPYSDAATPDCGPAIAAALADWPETRFVPLTGPPPEAAGSSLHPASYRQAAGRIAPLVASALAGVPAAGDGAR